MQSDLRRSWIVVLIALILYVIGFLLFPPQAFLVTDETFYVEQAMHFSKGSNKIVRVGRDFYPLGTSLVQTPFVRLGGWQAAVAASLLAFIVSSLLLARWLMNSQRSPIFTLLFIGFPPVLVMARLAMSDVIAAFIVVLAIWEFWKEPSVRARFGSGLLGGLLPIFREVNLIILLPFYVGAIVRRDRNIFSLLFGGGVGAAIWLLGTRILSGEFPSVQKEHLSTFSLSALIQNAPLYLFALLVMVPGGLLVAFLYRGARRPEMIAAILFYSVVICAYGYSAEASSLPKRLILGPRYLIPLVPLLSFAMADVFSRVRDRYSGVVQWLGRCWAACVFIAVCAIHPVMARWTEETRETANFVRSRVTHGLILSNRLATEKYINPVYGTSRVIDFSEITPREIHRIAKRSGTSVWLIVLERNETEFWRQETDLALDYVARVAEQCVIEKVATTKATRSGTITIWKVIRCDQEIKSSD